MGKRVGITYSIPGKLKPYADALRLVGLEPVPLRAGDAVSLDALDGLLISGGCDLNPRRYGQTPHPETQPPDDARDELEDRLLGEALDRDLPVLAICRGMQLFNVHHGGTLDQHVEGHEKPAAELHTVTVAPDTKLAGILGEGDHPVNSRHHQVVKTPGEGLQVSATSDDGTIESLERADKRFAVAVQWHPEDQASHDEEQRKLFQAFADAICIHVE
jgi:gamma-glutamyl-gamma-aminobutyrate hydrolase PuuD